MGFLSFAAISAAGFWLSVSPGQYSEAWLCDLWAGARCHAARCEADMEACEAAAQRCASASHHRVVNEEEARPLADCARFLLQADCEAHVSDICQGYMQAPQP